MAKIRFSLVAALAFLLTLNVASAVADTGLISRVCSASSNPSFCLKTLSSDKRSPGANLAGLAWIAIDLAESSATTTSNLIFTLKQKAKNPIENQVYGTCSETYNEAIKGMEDCRNDLKKGDFGSMNIHASAAMDGFDTCDQGFSDAKLPEPAELKSGGQRLSDLTSIVLVISNRLPALTK